MTFEIEAAIRSPDDDAAFEALTEVEVALQKHVREAMDIGLISRGSAFTFKLHTISLDDCSVSRREGTGD